MGSKNTSGHLDGRRSGHSPDRFSYRSTSGLDHDSAVGGRYALSRRKPPRRPSSLTPGDPGVL